MATFGLRYFAQLRSKYKGVFNSSVFFPGDEIRIDIVFSSPLTGNLFCRIQHLYLDNIEGYEALEIEYHL